MATPVNSRINQQFEAQSRTAPTAENLDKLGRTAIFLALQGTQALSRSIAVGKPPSEAFSHLMSAADYFDQASEQIAGMGRLVTEMMRRKLENETPAP